VSIDEITVAKPGKAVGVTASAAIDETKRSKHILYYAMQMFYANGGKAVLRSLGRPVQGHRPALDVT